MKKEFLTILFSELENPNKIEDYKYLLSFKALDKEYLKMIEYVLTIIETTGNVPTITMIKEEFEIEDLLGVSIIPVAQLHEKIEMFILKYNRCLIENTISTFSNEKIISKELIDTLLNNKYKECKPFDNFKLAEVQTSNEILFSTGIDYIDQYTNGLALGTITSIVGSDSGYKSLLALNIAYLAITAHKNVLYVSLGTDKEYTFLKFLTRHSCNNETEALEYPKLLKGEIDLDLYNNTLQDFKNNFENNLIILDEKKFDFFTLTVWNRVLYTANKTFEETTNHGIDLIVVDDFTLIKLEDEKRKNIINMNTILNTYMSYFRNQSKNFLNMSISIPIVLTIQATSFGIFKASSNVGNYTMDCLYEEVQKLSDTIISVYDECSLCNNYLVKVQLVKGLFNMCNFIDYTTPEKISAAINYWSLGNVPFLNEEVKKKLEEYELLYGSLEERPINTTTCTDEELPTIDFNTTQVNYTLNDTKIIDNFEQTDKLNSEELCKILDLY